MTLIYLWIYTLLLVVLWWFFVIAKIHAYKFKNFSKNIEKITKLLLFLLLLLSIIWYIIIFISSNNTTVVEFRSEIDFLENAINY